MMTVFFVIRSYDIYEYVLKEFDIAFTKMLLHSPFASGVSLVSIDNGAMTQQKILMCLYK